jgi:hypothetical protein
MESSDIYPELITLKQHFRSVYSQTYLLFCFIPEKAVLFLFHRNCFSGLAVTTNSSGIVAHGTIIGIICLVTGRRRKH